jgi:hypothetical protein
MHNKPITELIMKPDYTTQNTKENTPELNLNDYIHYLYKELRSKITSPSPQMYDQIKQFVNSPEGQLGFEQFKTLNLSIKKTPPQTHIKRTFQP